MLATTLAMPHTHPTFFHFATLNLLTLVATLTTMIATLHAPPYPFSFCIRRKPEPFHVFNNVLMSCFLKNDVVLKAMVVRKGLLES